MGSNLLMMLRALVVFAVAAVAYVTAQSCSSDSADLPAIQIRMDHCPASAPFFGFMGCTSALVFACLGAAYGTAKSGVGVGNMGVLHADMVMKSIIPIIMAGVLGIYGLIVAVLLASSITGDNNYSYASCSGLAGLAAGVAIGVVGDAGVRCNARNPKLFVGVILILIFAEALGLYGLIVALILSSNTMKCDDISQFTIYSEKCA